MRAVYVTHNGPEAIDKAYDDITRHELETAMPFCKHGIYKPGDMEEYRDEMVDVEFIFSTWGMPNLSQSEIARYFPNLKAIFYAAGSVQNFARSFFAKGIRVFSAFSANAVPVAEYAVAQIILAGKGFYQASKFYSEGNRDRAIEHFHAMPGNYNINIGILGAGAIGSMVISRLKAYEYNIMVFDPFLSDERATMMGVEKAGLLRVFAHCDIISNHLANNDKTKNMLDYSCFGLMKPHATFINTGRGAQVIENDLVRALEEKKDCTAVLDVTYPEPVLPGHSFFSMSNVFLTPHIAGSSGREISRMGKYMLGAYRDYSHNLKSNCEVFLEQLDTMA